MRTQGEDSHLQAKDRGFRKKQPCPHLDLELLGPNRENINVCCLSPQVCFGHPNDEHRGRLLPPLQTREIPPGPVSSAALFPDLEKRL